MGVYINCLMLFVLWYFSCDRVVWLEERNFWLFEACMLASSIVFSLYAYGRQKILDHRMLRRVQKQLANSV